MVRRIRVNVRVPEDGKMFGCRNLGRMGAGSLVVDRTDRDREEFPVGSQCLAGGVGLWWYQSLRRMPEVD